jgi:hypothetical protein
LCIAFIKGLKKRERKGVGEERRGEENRAEKEDRQTKTTGKTTQVEWAQNTSVTH